MFAQVIANARLGLGHAAKRIDPALVEPQVANALALQIADARPACVERVPIAHPYLRPFVTANRKQVPRASVPLECAECPVKEVHLGVGVGLVHTHIRAWCAFLWQCAIKMNIADEASAAAHRL